ncbi:MFS transporter [Mesorhizobium sp. M1300]|uniref:MFS transporter n=1 Tax=Mesorhizobium sp. M1300 TaxID=2957077 RepID=UPI00333814EB
MSVSQLIFQLVPRRRHGTSPLDYPGRSNASATEGRLVPVFTAAIAAIVLSLYASQPLLGLIGTTFEVGPEMAGLVPTVTLLGYAAGLIFLVPLIDLMENRWLIGLTLVLMVLSLIASALAPTAALFLVASTSVGITSTVAQMLVPVIARLAAEKDRGRIVGTVQSGIVVGVLLSRPSASLAAEFLGWRAFYGIMAVLVAVLGLILARVVKAHRPATGLQYGALIGSLWKLIREEPLLRRRVLYQFLLMAAFNIFWTAVALRLAEPPFGLDQIGIAAFALVGIPAALIAPFTGRIADRGWSDGATRFAHLSAFIGVVLIGLPTSGGWGLWEADRFPWLSLAALAIGAVLLNLGTVADQVLGRIAINTVRPEARGRMNALFTGLFFLGGSAGSSLAGVCWAQAGWAGISGASLVFAFAALIASSANWHPGTPSVPGETSTNL